MIIHDEIQGTDEWAALRRSKFTASEASAMMGVSPKVKRTELLHMKATGSEREFSDWVQRNLLDKGHEIEAAARPLAETIIGEELFPVTGSSEVDDRLLASMDGLTMLHNIGWECKSWNEAKAAEVSAGRVPEEDYWQVVQQMLVSGAGRWLYMVTDGTEEGSVHVWVERDQAAEDKLLHGWDQFEEDLAKFKPEAPQAAVVGTSPESLPTLIVEVTGMVKSSNLDHFKKHALAVVGSIKTDLQDDQDFADAEQAVKWCSTVEDRLKLIKDQILGQTADIDAIFKTIDEISAQARGKRLQLDKLVKDRKQTIRDEIVMEAKADFEKHLTELEKGFGGKIRMPAVAIDVAGAIKGKKTIASLRDAAGTELARAKVEATLLASKITANLATLRELGAGLEFLFADAQQLVQKDNEDLRAVIANRINEHKQKVEEQARQQLVEQERQAEQRRLQQEQQQAQAAEQAKQQEPVHVGVDMASGPDQTVTMELALTPAAEGWRAEVVNLQELVAAVARGDAPIDIIRIDQAALDIACKAYPLPGCVVKGAA